MPAGVPTDEAVVAAFRADYLLTGNAAKSSRAVGIPVRTGRSIAMRLVGEPEFAVDSRRLRETEMFESLASRREVRRISLIRFKSPTGGIDVKRFSVGDVENVTITDKRHEYGKLILDSEKNAIALARIEGEKAGTLTPPGRIEVVLVDSPPDKPDPEKSGE